MQFIHSRQMLCVIRNIICRHSSLRSFHISSLFSNSHLKKSSVSDLEVESKIPDIRHEHKLNTDYDEEVELDEATLKQLQRWSLVKLDDEKALETLKRSIKFANKILSINTDGVEPLYTVLENKNLQLRDDIVAEGNCREEVLSNAKFKEENYFVAPPGNIPLEKNCSTISKHNINKKVIKYLSGPLGAKFKENLKQQWINFCTSNLEIGFFMLSVNNTDKSSKTLISNLKEIKYLCNSQVPIGFSIAKEYANDHDFNAPILQSLMFLSPTNSQHKYFQWLRQRKIWWSHFSVSPGNIQIKDQNFDLLNTNFKNHLQQLNTFVSDKIHDLNIIIKIHENDLPIETVGLYEQNSKTGLYMEDQSVKILPHVIISSINLKNACHGLLQECLDKNDNFILHYNLAPFQCRIICDYTDMEERNELKDLGQYLCGLLRKSQISTLYINDNSELNDILDQTDQMGIPYSLILRANSLKNGFIYLRNRDTTLEEQIHVSDIPKYLQLLCKK